MDLDSEFPIIAVHSIDVIIPWTPWKSIAWGRYYPDFDTTIIYFKVSVGGIYRMQTSQCDIINISPFQKLTQLWRHELNYQSTPQLDTKYNSPAIPSSWFYCLRYFACNQLVYWFVLMLFTQHPTFRNRQLVY